MIDEYYRFLSEIEIHFAKEGAGFRLFWMSTCNISNFVTTNTADSCKYDANDIS
jgi:hypothetical protein